MAKLPIQVHLPEIIHLASPLGCNRLRVVGRSVRLALQDFVRRGHIPLAELEQAEVGGALSCVGADEDLHGPA